MRHARIKADGAGHYHCISRIIECRMILGFSGSTLKMRVDGRSCRNCRIPRRNGNTEACGDRQDSRTDDPPMRLVALESHRTVAVGTPVAGCPPHRSVHAALPHTALSSST